MTKAAEPTQTAGDLNARTDAVVVESKDVAFRAYFRVDRYTLRHAQFAGGLGSAITRELLERGHAVAVLPYDPVRDEVVLLEQFRIGALAAGMGPWLLEVVAGVIDPGETAEAVAARETKEESGCHVADLESVARWLSSPGCTSETVELFVGRVDSSRVGGVHGLAQEGEDIRPVAMAADAFLDLLHQGRLDNATVLIAAQWLALNRAALRARWLGSS
ncbi:NUDIX domain-containing protein [Roseospira marina]|uniref:ADP-ribose pyrophosphatase n=1 Tax=Roseospira marina TaxID=140057 RepID=A0A5M6IEP2_9PROT|nr:NUDIX domain-containing protein [Roseospira marina]KAA5606746.1 NUDIX domain-containing protein [Roseospira marina]MBB4313834.1 ADP-ribose pyrophosphatase [Roseospira marina]MBB5086996.1 ADP-ribose pyrophosphatase [Roseospira marina]